MVIFHGYVSLPEGMPLKILETKQQKLVDQVPNSRTILDNVAERNPTTTRTSFREGVM